ncbi:MAG TPA: RsmE family RNA methyltransferase [Candidatus Paceibacterota bacterium]|nr:RsmE family RNA methyltransferase [Candidatus Paceibacterota bacterium]
MRQNRFYLEGDIGGKFLELTDSAIVKQIKNVLRLKEGDCFSLFNGLGIEIKVEIKNYKKQSIELKVISREKREESTPQVCLYLAILKKENFELAVQKAVEAGVSKIVPVVTERTVKLGLKVDRLKLIIKEATEQSGRFLIPELAESIDFSGAVALAKKENSLNIFCSLSEERENEAKISPPVFERINIFIGPEGGWDIKEQEKARLAGFLLYSLGEYVLRAETAAVVVTWLAVNKKL